MFSKNICLLFSSVLYYPFAHDAYYTYGQNQLIRAYLVAFAVISKNILHNRYSHYKSFYTAKTIGIIE